MQLLVSRSIRPQTKVSSEIWGGAWVCRHRKENNALLQLLHLLLLLLLLLLLWDAALHHFHRVPLPSRY